MKIAIVAPSPVPFGIGGAENLWWGLLEFINQHTSHQADLIKLPSPERNFWEIVRSYRAFSQLDLSGFDLVISTKYPAWMIDHPNHICYLQHRLRGLYDTYPDCAVQPEDSAPHFSVRSLQALMRQCRGDRKVLSEFFERIEELRVSRDVAEATFRFPGPFCREVVHFLDGIGLSPAAVRRFAAISRNVAGRREYFPAGARVEVIHHPSFLKSFRQGDGQYLLTVGRLDNGKRLDLLIRAMKRASAELQLKIVGTGPNEAALRELAGEDERIELLGFRNDSEVEELYANALAVPYVPFDEDFGLVTIEAMMSGKPVLTTTDAGGPNEFVRHGETGFSVAPDETALAGAIDYIGRNRQEVGAMGRRARESVKHITWECTVSRLLGSHGGVGSLPGPSKRRRKITVASTFPVYPPRGGGQSRIYHLYRRLAADFDVDLVTLSDAGKSPLCMEIGPGLREIRVSKSSRHEEAEARWSKKVNGVPITDVAMPRLCHLTPAYLEALGASAATADAVVASHPYTIDAIEKVAVGKEIWYEAHNVEFELKKRALPDSGTGRKLLEEARRAEERCCAVSRLVLTCSADDGRKLTELYSLDPAKVVEVPNGVDTETVSYTTHEKRKALQQRLGISGACSVLFLASWHGPNLDAVRRLFEVAVVLPDVNFVIVGSAGLAFQNDKKPANVGFMGEVDDETKDAVLAVVDIAVNPVQYGSGTNLKMLDYCAAGIPVITTAHGARGLALHHPEHLLACELADFPEAICRVRSSSPMELQARIASARSCVERLYDWKIIAKNLKHEMRRKGFF